MTAGLLDAPAAAALLARGGVLAYPTEGVWGLGCDPFDAAAVQRLFEVKQRPQAKGLILIAFLPAVISLLFSVRTGLRRRVP